VEIVRDGRRYGRVHPVVAGERIAKLLKLPDGCNALLVEELMGKAKPRPSLTGVEMAARTSPGAYVGCHFFTRFTLLRPMYLGRRAGADWFRLRRFMTSDTSWLS